MKTEIIKRIVEKHGAKTRGFRRAVLLVGGEINHNDVRRAGVVPDAFVFVDPPDAASVMTAYVASPVRAIDDDDFDRYTQLWWLLDSESVDLRLIAVDGDGVETQLDLGSRWYDLLAADVYSRRADEHAKMADACEDEADALRRASVTNYVVNGAR